MVFTRIIIFLLLLVVGFAILRYTEALVRLFGHNELAEKYLGAGGSYTMWKLVAIFLMIIGLLYLGGTINLFPEETKLNPSSIEEVK